MRRRVAALHPAGAAGAPNRLVVASPALLVVERARDIVPRASTKRAASDPAFGWRRGDARGGRHLQRPHRPRYRREGRAHPQPAARLRAAGPRQALAFLVLQCLVGLGVLLSFNWFAVGTGLVSLVFVAIYPFMKRITSWPQAVLGLAFAGGGCSAGPRSWGVSPGRLSSSTPPRSSGRWAYDTIYALQDIRDEFIIGVRSTARLFGASVRPAVGALFAGAVFSSRRLCSPRMSDLPPISGLSASPHTSPGRCARSIQTISARH